MMESTINLRGDEAKGIKGKTVGDKVSVMINGVITGIKEYDESDSPTVVDENEKEKKKKTKKYLSFDIKLSKAEDSEEEDRKEKIKKDLDKA